MTLDKDQRCKTARTDSETMKRASRLAPLLSRALCPAILALGCGLIVGPARAELVSSPNLPPFSAEDQVIIARNETLKAVVQTEPWIVFRVLRDLDAAGPTTRSFDGSSGVLPTPQFDAKKDPDLQLVPRASAEASQDLFALIKKASAGGLK